MKRHRFMQLTGVVPGQLYKYKTLGIEGGLIIDFVGARLSLAERWPMAIQVTDQLKNGKFKVISLERQKSFALTEEQIKQNYYMVKDFSDATL